MPTIETDFSGPQPITTTRRRNSGRRNRASRIPGRRVSNLGDVAPRYSPTRPSAPPEEPPRYSPTRPSAPPEEPPRYSPTRPSAPPEEPPRYSPTRPSASPKSPPRYSPTRPSAPPESGSNTSGDNDAITKHIQKFVYPKVFGNSANHQYQHNPIYTLSPTANIAEHPLYPRVQQTINNIMNNPELQNGLYAFKVPAALDYYFVKKISDKQMGTVYKIPLSHQNLVKSSDNDYGSEIIKFIGNNKKLTRKYTQKAKLNLFEKERAIFAKEQRARNRTSKK